MSSILSAYHSTVYSQNAVRTECHVDRWQVNILALVLSSIAGFQRVDLQEHLFIGLLMNELIN